jgi:thiol-disulfide isomerase/thioredoxin
VTVWFFHPTDRALLAFAASGESAMGFRRLKAHLARCQECRDTVAFMRKLAVDAAALEGPVQRDGLVDRIRERVAARASVLLPVEESRPANPRRRLAAAAVVTLMAGGIGIVWGVNAATGSTEVGELRFSPASIQPGPIVARYRSAGLFGDAARLVLRARYRTKWGEAYQWASRQSSVAVLVREGSGNYRATFAIPDSVVYAAFSVENEPGTLVDDNGHQLWYLARRAPDGRPLSEALTQRSNDLMGENMELSMRVLQEQSRLYPDSPAVWGGVVGIERFLLGQARADSTLPEHCDRLKRFDSFYHENLSTTVHDADAIVQFSVQLDRTKCPVASPVGRYWQDRVLNDSSGSEEGRVRRYSRDASPLFKDPKRSLALTEQYWPARGSFGTMLANNALSAARGANDGPAALKWADRYVAKAPSLAPQVYGTLASLKDIHEATLDRLRATLQRLQTRQDSLRPLETPVAQQARLDSAATGPVLAAIGKLLLSDGHKAAALDTLRLAAGREWDPRLFGDVAQALLAGGDTTGAIELMARVVADPSTRSTVADSLTRVASARMNPSAWRAAVDSARALLRNELLGEAVELPIRGKIRLQTLDGQKTDLAKLTHGRVVVVSFWSRYCGASLQQFPGITELARQLDERGIALVPVLNEKPSPELRKYVAGTHVVAPVFTDTWGEATRAFHDFGTPIFFVVDAAGRIRYRYSSLAKVLTQAVAIRGESGDRP